MDTIISYLFDKGGVLGLLLVFTIAWIAYRETYYYNKDKQPNPASGDSKPEIDKILYIVEDLKSKKDEQSTKSDLDKLSKFLERLVDGQEEHSDNLSEINQIVIQMSSLDRDIERKIQDLWGWHAVFDNEGVPVWYVRRSLEESIDSLDLTITNLQDKCLQANDVLRNDLMIRLQKVNDERIAELKTLLEVYNKTVTDLIVTLEKLKAIIKSEDDGD